MLPRFDRALAAVRSLPELFSVPCVARLTDRAQAIRLARGRGPLRCAVGSQIRVRGLAGCAWVQFRWRHSGSRSQHRAPDLQRAGGPGRDPRAPACTLGRLPLHYEILCIDDGSTDGSGALLDELAATDAKLVPIQFTRNFGKEAALQAGVERARGEAALYMDADLQHPPELIPEMVELWREDGYEVVEARKHHRGGESLVYRGLARLFGRLMDGARGD